MRRLKSLVFLTALLFAPGCAANHPWETQPKSVSGLPDRFIVSLAPAKGQDANQLTTGCAGRLEDPRDHTQLTLVRSTARGSPVLYWGDYAVTHAERYRLGPPDLLRIDCGSGRPLGRVPR